ncbi:MAG: hypothetical protein ABIT37_03805 [Luteolibacter sp.]
MKPDFPSLIPKPMNTVLFAAARHRSTRKDLLKLIREVHPAHPCHFTFASDRDRREYERELKGELIDHVRNHLVIVIGPPISGKTQLLRALIELKHGADKLPTFTPRNASEIEKCLASATLSQADACFFDNLTTLKCSQLSTRATAEDISFRRMGMQRFETVPNTMRIYITCPVGTKVPAELERRSRIIRLASYQVSKYAA